jgi:bacillithiol system protein YtxJ
VGVFGNLFAKKTNQHAIPVLGGCTNVDDLMRDDLVVLFKHSASCPVSWAAHSVVTRFLRAHPDAPVRLIPVLKERPLSQKIAAATGIRHESPQVIVLRRGQVVASASHGDITVDNLTKFLASAEL